MSLCSADLKTTQPLYTSTECVSNSWADCENDGLSLAGTGTDKLSSQCCVIWCFMSAKSRSLLVCPRRWRPQSCSEGHTCSPPPALLMMISPLAHLPELETPADQLPAALAPQTPPLPVCSLLDWLVWPVESDRDSHMERFVKVALLKWTVSSFSALSEATTYFSCKWQTSAHLTHTPRKGSDSLLCSCWCPGLKHCCTLSTH